MRPRSAASAAPLRSCPIMWRASTSSDPAPALLGRSAVCDRIDALIAAAARGTGGSLVVRGEPGLGKSALLDAVAAGLGDGDTVLRVRGVEAEHGLDFAALHQLLRPVLPLAAALPEP